MARVTQTRTSLRDLDNIWDYIAKDSPEKASQFIRELREKMEILSDQPHMGRSRAELSPGLRSFPFGNYIVFYRVADDGIIISRVLHGRQNIEDLFE